jgi:preprotein translocase subunit SecA
MRHIDAMSALREEVAFEWYAQKQPLIVYKQKAFEKFWDLIDELEYKVIKSIFTIHKINEIEEANILNQNLNFKNESNSTNKQIPRQTNVNPLINNPNSESSNRVKIRV